MEGQFININGTVINLNQVAYVNWFLMRGGRNLVFWFPAALSAPSGEMFKSFPDSPAVRAAWQHVSMNIPTFTDIETPETEPTS